MANKELTAKVKLDCSDAEAKLKRLTSLIQGINKAVTGYSNTGKLESTLAKQVIQAEKVKQATLKTEAAQEKLNQEIGKTFVVEEKVNQAITKSLIEEEKLTAQKYKTEIVAQKLKDATAQSAQEAQKFSKNLQYGESKANALLTTIKRLASTYLGIMGTKAVLTTSDTITSAENRLNNLEGGSPELTQATMDKIYAASQRSRSGYGDMLGNVSKSMTLANGAFNGNIDNAIKFQEIMSKAYTVGGASAAEQSSSMYQLIQALGSGVLQGDELRSVREGAPLAYKAIEEFAQGVLDTDESLKDLASQGKITSDMVVAAIMDMENGADNINAKFENTAMTFAQAGQMIQNSATKAFEPVLQKLNDILNSDLGRGMIDGICNALIWLAKAVEIVLSVFEKFFNWCAENWEWLKYVILGAITVIIALLAQMAWQAILTGLQAAWAFLQANWQLLVIVGIIMLILWVYELWRQGTLSTVEFIVALLIIIAVVALAVGMVLNMVWLVWVALAILAIATIMLYFAEFCGYVCGVWEWIKAGAWNLVTALCNFGMALMNFFGAVCENIGIAFENAWIGAQNMFWAFIQNVLEGIRFLEPAINAIAQAFGAEGFTLSGVIDDVSSKQQQTKAYRDLGEAWSSGWNTFEYEDLGEAFDKGYDNGYEWGSDIVDKINEWGSQFQGQGSENDGLFTDLYELLGLNGLLDPYDPANGLSSDAPSNSLGNIDDNTSDIKDSMDLTQEDLEYLRRVADMEWKKEFTTASITVDMSNYNTINGENDLDGIVEKLADKLYDEMNAVANGVYA